MGNQQTSPQAVMYDRMSRQVHAPVGQMPAPMARVAGGDYERRSMMSGVAYGQDYSGSHAGLPADSERGPGCGGYRGGCGPCGQSRPAGMCMTVIPDDPADHAPDGPAFNAWPCSTRDNAYGNKDIRGDPDRHNAGGVSMHAFANAATDRFTDPRFTDTTHPGYVDRQFACGGPGGCR